MNTEPKPHSFSSAPQAREPAPRPAGDPCPIVRAVNTAIMQLIRLPIPRTLHGFDAADFEGRKELLEQFAAIIDPVVAAITSEAAEHDPGTHIDRKGTTRMLAEALEDRCVLSAFEAAADDCRERDNEACEPQGSARARDAMGG